MHTMHPFPKCTWSAWEGEGCTIHCCRYQNPKSARGGGNEYETTPNAVRISCEEIIVFVCLTTTGKQVAKNRLQTWAKINCKDILVKKRQTYHI